MFTFAILAVVRIVLREVKLVVLGVLENALKAATFAFMSGTVN